MTDPEPLRDIKDALSSTRKPDLSHVRGVFMTYVARGCEYGDDKYERANYMRVTRSTREDFCRLRTYLRAAVNHVMATLDQMETHQSTDPKLVDGVGMEQAAIARDYDVTEGAKVGASYLPHLAHACSSLQMAIVQAVRAGLLPADPGTPWK